MTTARRQLAHAAPRRCDFAGSRRRAAGDAARGVALRTYRQGHRRVAAKIRCIKQEGQTSCTFHTVLYIKSAIEHAAVASNKQYNTKHVAD